mmetsp:Transcript_142181/g.247807  ORF Transcript_142181/g.247807 Transcript_142181/m.247807 type:complete len:268 (+) Transcript_142181:150-953(+)
MHLTDTSAGGSAVAEDISAQADEPSRGRYSTLSVELETESDIMGKAALERIASYGDTTAEAAPATSDALPYDCGDLYNCLALCESPRAKADLVQQMLKEKELFLRESQEAEKVEKEKMLATVAAAQAEHSAKAWPLLDWMYADAITGVLSHHNPLRWRSWVGGALTLPEAVQEFQDLAEERAVRGKGQRPVIIKIPPGFWNPELKFNNFDAAIAHVTREMGEANMQLADAKAKYERAKQQVAHAQEEVQRARTDAEEAQTAALAARA